MGRGSAAWWFQKPLTQKDLGLSLTSSSPLLYSLGFSLLPQTEVLSDTAGSEDSPSTTGAGCSVWCMMNVEPVLGAVLDGPLP